MYGVIQSLNVSVAAGVVLYEAVRQRGVERGWQVIKDDRSVFYKDGRIRLIGQSGSRV